MQKEDGSLSKGKLRSRLIDNHIKEALADLIVAKIYLLKETPFRLE